MPWEGFLLRILSRILRSNCEVYYTRGSSSGRVQWVTDNLRSANPKVDRRSRTFPNMWSVYKALFYTLDNGCMSEFGFRIFPPLFARCYTSRTNIHLQQPLYDSFQAIGGCLYAHVWFMVLRICVKATIHEGSIDHMAAASHQSFRVSWAVFWNILKHCYVNPKPLMTLALLVGGGFLLSILLASGSCL